MISFDRGASLEYLESRSETLKNLPNPYRLFALSGSANFLFQLNPLKIWPCDIPKFLKFDKMFFINQCL